MQGEGDLPPLKRRGKGARAAQAERGSLGKPLAGARGYHPLAAFAVAVAFWESGSALRAGTGPLRRVAEDCEAGRRQGGDFLPPTMRFYIHSSLPNEPMNSLQNIHKESPP